MAKNDLLLLDSIIDEYIQISKLIISKWHDILKYTDDCTKM